MEKRYPEYSSSMTDVLADQQQTNDREVPVRYPSFLAEGDIYTIHDQTNIRKQNQGFKYFRLKYWDGHNWIVRFIKTDDTDWIGLSEGRITGMISDNVIEKATAAEQLEAIIMEGKNESGGWKSKLIGYGLE